MLRVLALALALLPLAATPASAREIVGTHGADRLTGTQAADRIFGRAGADRLVGRRGADLLVPGLGRDSALGGAGDDRVAAQDDGARDAVACGPGRDVVTADPDDRVAGDCDVVSRRLSRDPYRRTGAQHETQAEPDSFTWGDTTVAVFQSGRYRDGGAANIGWATSSDRGRTWRRGFLPGLSLFSTPAGIWPRVSDPVVAYDAAHGLWLAASLAIGTRETALLVSRSADGLAWSLPVTAARAATGSLAYDKEWIACDNWSASPYRGRCYLSYTDIAAERLATIRSDDGGATWSAPAAGPRAPLAGAFPLPRPGGDLVVVYWGLDPQGIYAIRSTDGGAGFSAPVLVSRWFENDANVMRAPPLPSADVGPDGTVHVTWHDCRFRPSCAANDVLVASSADGISWTAPLRAPRVPGHESFLPALAADPGSQAVAVLFYSAPAGCRGSRCRLDAWLAVSPEHGAPWRRAQRLTAQPMPVGWIATASGGRMLGDYFSVTFVRGAPLPVFAIASEPRAGLLRQAIYATTVLR